MKNQQRVLIPTLISSHSTWPDCTLLRQYSPPHATAAGRLWCLLLAVMLLTSVVPVPGAVLHVYGDAAGGNDGSTWADAFTDLQLALVSAVPGDEIWVAAGSYKPTGPIERGGRGKPFPLDSRMISFHLKSGVGVYGGFSGTELERNRRNPATNTTVLSGDLNSDDRTVAVAADLANEPTRSDNSLHVVTATGADNTAVLDGFIITGGYANETGHDDGGGMINIGQLASTEGPTIIDCGFEWNFALWNGGGIYNVRSNLILIGCTFRHNHSEVPGWAGTLGDTGGVGGGGMHSRQADPRLFDCRFNLNSTRGGEGDCRVTSVAPSSLAAGSKRIRSLATPLGRRAVASG